MTTPPAGKTIAERRGQFRQWASLVLLLIPALALFAWAGSAPNPRNALPWGWTKTGWLTPRPGLGMLLIAAAFLFWILSEIATLLFHPVKHSTKLKPAVNAAVIFLLAIAVRIFIARRWTPLPLNQSTLESPILPAAISLRWLAISGDLLVLPVLMLSLRGANRSLWWAVFYALSPVVLIEVAANGHPIAWCMAPVVFLIGISLRLPTVIHIGLTASAALAATVGILLLALGGHGFNSLAFEMTANCGGSAPWTLPVLGFLFEALVVWTAIVRRWTLARGLLHVLLVFLICSPVMRPWMAVPILAILPLVWSRAGWILSATVMGAYVAVVMLRVGVRFHVPDWVLLLEWVPVIVLEAYEILAELFAALPRFNPRLGSLNK